MIMTNNIFSKSYNHNDWIDLCDKAVNFLVVFGTIINLIIFGFFGLGISSLTSFMTLMLIGGCRLAVSIIKFFKD